MLEKQHCRVVATVLCGYSAIVGQVKLLTDANSVEEAFLA
jgi:hypothetical protein